MKHLITKRIARKIGKKVMRSVTEQVTDRIAEKAADTVLKQGKRILRKHAAGKVFRKMLG